MGNDIKDDTEQVVDSKEADVDAKVPTEKEHDQAQSAVNIILEKHGFESVEDLESALESGQTIKDLIGGRDAKDLITKAELLDKYEAHWAEQERQKQMEEETPEQTIERLQKEAAEKDKELQSFKDTTEKEKEFEKTIKAFDGALKNEIDKAEDIPKEFKKFLGVFVGHKHPVTEVAIDDLPAVKKMAKSQIKLFKDFEQVIIRRYLDGKSELIDVPPTDTDAAPVDKGGKIKNLKDAKRVLREKFAIA